ncbi:unnamed protein product, partial [Lampetra planeri]
DDDDDGDDAPRCGRRWSACIMEPPLRAPPGDTIEWPSAAAHAGEMKARVECIESEGECE